MLLLLFLQVKLLLTSLFFSLSCAKNDFFWCSLPLRPADRDNIARVSESSTVEIDVQSGAGIGEAGVCCVLSV